MIFLAKTPFLRLTLFLAIGIVLGEFIGFNLWAISALSLVGVVLAIVAWRISDSAKNYKLQCLFGVATFCLLCAIGCTLHHLQDEHTRLNFPAETAVYQVELTSAPIEKSRSNMFRANVVGVADSLHHIHTCNKHVILYIAKDSASSCLQRGQQLLVSSNIALPTHTGNPDEFDYGQYLRRQGIGGSGYVSANSWQIVGENQHFSLLKLADDCRQYLLSIYKRMGLSGDEFGMLAALTLGYKDALTPELRESFSTTGAMHVLAVSGLHVGIIYAVLAWLLGIILPKTKRGERIRSALIIVFLWFYAFITGLSPSVMRATIMFSFMALAGIFGRQSQTYNTIFLSAFVLLLFKPTLLFEIGFQLSYSAVIAIIYFEPQIVGLLTVKNRCLRWAWELMAVSLAAQIGTAPFSLFYFHQFPNYFLLSNFVVIPAATLILYTAIALFAVSWIPYVGVAVAWLLNGLLKSMYFLITCIEHLPHALSYVWIDEWQLLLLYLSIIVLGFCCYRFSFRNIVLMLTCILALLGVHFYQHYQNLNRQELVVFNHSKTLMVNSVSAHQNLVITTDSTLCNRLAEDYWLHVEAPTPCLVNDSAMSANAFKFDTKSVLVLTENYFKYKVAEQPLQVDYLIVGREVYPSDDFFQFVQPTLLITSGDVQPWRNERFRQLATDYGCEFYSVREQGAWRSCLNK